MSRRYDSRTTTFSPDGRLYQVEYALEAINNASSTLCILAKDGVVIAADKAVSSKLLESTGEKEKIYKLDEHILCAAAGWTADAHVLIAHARLIGQRYLYTFNEPHPVERFVTRLADVKQSYTQFGGLRPFGVSFFIAGYDAAAGLQLFQTDPAGNYRGWKATAMGKNAAAAQTILREKWRDDLSVKEALALATQVLAKTADTNALNSEHLEFGVLSVADGAVSQRILGTAEIAALVRDFQQSAADGTAAPTATDAAAAIPMETS